MKNRTRLLVIVALIALCAVALVAAFAQCGRQPSPIEETPDRTAVPTTPGATAPTALPDTATAESTAPTGPSTPTPTLTREEELVIERQHHSSQSASTPEECTEILKTEPWCSVVKDAVRITRPEWEELFPQAEFFLVKYDLYGGEFVQQRNLLIVEQDDQRYTAETFDHLLEANGITEVTGENRELVARAFALMTIPDYLEEEVVFEQWEEGSWPASFDWHYNYGLTAWTEIQGLTIQWWFMFEDGHLRITDGAVIDRQVGDYIDIPFTELSPPSSDAFLHYYWGG